MAFTSTNALFRRGSETAFNEGMGMGNILTSTTLLKFGNFFIMERQAYNLMRAIGNVALLQNRGTHLHTKICKIDQAEATDSTALLVSIRNDSSSAYVFF